MVICLGMKVFAGYIRNPNVIERKPIVKCPYHIGIKECDSSLYILEWYQKKNNTISTLAYISMSLVSLPIAPCSR